MAGDPLTTAVGAKVGLEHDRHNHDDHHNHDDDHVNDDGHMVNGDI